MINDTLYHHNAERGLIGIAAAFVLINLTALSLLNPDQLPTNALAYLVWSGCAVAGHLTLNRLLPQRDPLIYPIVCFLMGWGLILIDRLQPAFADRQMVWVLLSSAALIATASLPQPLNWLRSYRYLWLIGGLVLLVSTIQLGRNPSGLTGAPPLWLGIGNIYFQPSEALKIILVAFLASYLAEQLPTLRAAQLGINRLSARLIGPVLLMWGICMVILVWQRDLGAALLFFGVFLILLYTASGYAPVLWVGALLIAAAGAAAYVLFDVVQLRIDIWLNPWPEADGRAYQIVQSLHAFAAGGVFGQGIGQGWATYIPVVHSDFIFAALAEEYGLLGVFCVLACFATLVMRGLSIAITHRQHPFYSLFAVGLSSLLGLQSLLIMGGILRILPLTGVTLPFVSYGGSSLLMSGIIAGLLLRLSAEGDTP